MQELEKLNPFKGTATNAMIMFLAINTSNIALLPLGVIGLRVSAGSSNPAEIFLPSLLATTCSTIVAITVALLLAKKDKNYREAYNKNLPAQTLTRQVGDASALLYPSEVANAANEKFLVPATNASKVLAISFLILLLSAFIYRLLDAGIMGCFKSDSALQTVLTFLSKEFGSFWLTPSLMLLIISYALFNGVKIYDTIVDGAKQGFELAVRIIPFLVVILVAVGMFRASGAMDFCVAILSPLTELIGLPAEILPMAIIRPLSGSGAYSFLSSVVNDAPNSYNAFLASVLNGSSETTFYVLAVYFGSIGIVKIRHAVLAALTADITGVLAACFFSPMFYA
jgi:spore maturation protein SpmB